MHSTTKIGTVCNASATERAAFKRSGGEGKARYRLNIYPANASGAPDYTAPSRYFLFSHKLGARRFCELASIKPWNF